MPQAPLTHHEILALVEPFTRRGRRVDLDATNRIERRIAFRPIDHPATAAGGDDLREMLELANPYGSTYRLTRVLRRGDGVEARLESEGAEPGALLAAVDAVAPANQFRAGPGYVIAHHQRVEPAAGTGAPQPALTEGVAWVGGLRLTVQMPTVRRYPVDIFIAAEPGDAIELPEDLLAVLGWDWAPLAPSNDGWKSKLRLRGKGVAQSRRVEALLEAAAQHLARTLAEQPRRFHERFRRARWGAAARRAIPLLAALAMVAAALMVPYNAIPEHSIWRLLIMNAPPLLLALAFCLQEMPRVEIPPLPRPSRLPAWRPAAAPASSVTPAPARPADAGAARLDAGSASDLQGAR